MHLKVDFHFDAAHRLPFYEGPCFHTHGHNYQLVVLVRGKVDPLTGIAVDFGEVKRIVREKALYDVDHNDLNRVLENPTAENVVRLFWSRLEGVLPGLVELQLYETPDCAVIYRGSEDGERTEAKA